ncbi:hypothetical protein [Caulobacter sp. S45]|uniref:hypothetical protein n=1 Tax=Caulobacter sp. S45 TaxID=1641861 RepID=UPI001575660B|nr:hypothetical protein [Caulobacter sp. S45]
MLAYILALAIAQADPAPAQAADAAPAGAAPASGVSAGDADTPKGAPVGDYDFVAWCHGALTGHMALYTQVKPELTSIERPDEVATDEKNDHAQMQAGRDYLALYTRALDGVDHTHRALTERRRSAEAKGQAIWDAAKAADARTRMWSWLLWDLPGRCETAAKSLQTRAGMLAALHSPAPTPDAPIGDPAPAGEPPKNIDDALSTAPAAAAPQPADGPPSLRGPQ